MQDTILSRVELVSLVYSLNFSKQSENSFDPIFFRLFRGCENSPFVAPRNHILKGPFSLLKNIFNINQKDVPKLLLYEQLTTLTILQKEPNLKEKQNWYLPLMDISIYLLAFDMLRGSSVVLRNRCGGEKI